MTECPVCGYANWEVCKMMGHTYPTEIDFYRGTAERFADALRAAGGKVIRERGTVPKKAPRGSRRRLSPLDLARQEKLF